MGRKIILCTQGSVGISVIRKLFELRFNPDEITVITYDTNILRNLSFIYFLKYFDIEWYVVDKDMNKLYNIVSYKNADILLSVSYKYIFKEPILSMPNIHLINLHPGILPDYRGCFSIPWAIINNEEYVGYSYHLIDAGIDTGDIILRDRFPVLPTSTAPELHFLVMNNAINNLGYIISGKWGTIPQIGTGMYYKNIFPVPDISWDDDKIERFNRAKYFPPHY